MNLKAVTVGSRRWRQVVDTMARESDPIVVRDMKLPKLGYAGKGAVAGEVRPMVETRASARTCAGAAASAACVAATVHRSPAVAMGRPA